ncbi:unnamed protein product [Ilex paraguariensis]|uniref:Uncharacterized protein n=1 Tax=Ilex paraguariensis TaxID=185542 RepID=A0ABC8SHS9_9AQUA
MDLESNIKGLLSEISDQKKKDDEYSHLNLMDNELNFTGVENFVNADEARNFVGSNGCRAKIDDDKRSVDEVKDDVALISNVVKKDESNRKRKREVHFGVLDWVTMVAKDPCDPAIESLPELSKWKYYGNELVWKQVLLVREAMLLTRSSDSSAEQSIWEEQTSLKPLFLIVPLVRSYVDMTKSVKLVL